MKLYFSLIACCLYVGASCVVTAASHEMEVNLAIRDKGGTRSIVYLPGIGHGRVEVPVAGGTGDIVVDCMQGASTIVYMQAAGTIVDVEKALIETGESTSEDIVVTIY